MLCENGVRNKNPKSLQVVQTSASVCVCTQMCTFIYMRNTANGTSSACMCVCMCVCVCAYVCVCGMGVFVCANVQ